MRHTAHAEQREILRHSPEIDLLFACVCPPGPAAVFERNPASLCAEVNWNKLLDLAAFHGVVPLLRRFLSQYAGEIAPCQFRADLERECHAAAIRSLFLTGELIALCEAFAKENIPVLPFKGPTLALTAYENLGLRQFADLDLLVRPEHTDRALRLLDTHGFQLDPRSARHPIQKLARWTPEIVCTHASRGVVVDLHWRLLLDHYPIQLDSEVLWKSVTKVKLAGSEIPSLSASVLLLLLAIHGSKHCWSRFGWIADFVWLLNRNPTLDLEELAFDARSYGCEVPFLLALAVAVDVCGTNLPVNLETRLRSDRSVASLRARVRQRSTAGLPKAPDTWELFSFGSGMAMHADQRVRHLLHLAVDPTEADWTAFRLPPALFWLYIPSRAARLFGKYALGMGKRRVVNGSLN